MNNIGRHYLLAMILVIPIYAFSLLASAQTADLLVSEQITNYQQQYPEIEFKLLHTAEDYEAMLPLTKSLGEGASNPEYEHPEEARILLLEAQQDRIGILIENDMSSATLFKTPSSNITDKPYLCVVTMSHQLSDWNPIAATQFMYNLDENIVKTMPLSMRLDNRLFAAYTIDHEVFHCIDVYTNGFLFPMTSDEIVASWNRSRAEIRAEAFASLAHLERQPDTKDFISNIANARTLNLLDWDIEHYTVDVLNNIVNAKTAQTTEDIKQLVHNSVQLASQNTPVLSDYKELIIATEATIEKLGLETQTIPASYVDLTQEISVNPDKVKIVFDQVKQAYLAINCEP
jgi:hypothetical protein